MGRPSIRLNALFGPRSPQLVLASSADCSPCRRRAPSQEPHVTRTQISQLPFRVSHSSLLRPAVALIAILAIHRRTPQERAARRPLWPPGRPRATSSALQFDVSGIRAWSPCPGPGQQPCRLDQAPAHNGSQEAGCHPVQREVRSARGPRSSIWSSASTPEHARSSAPATQNLTRSSQYKTDQPEALGRYLTGPRRAAILRLLILLPICTDHESRSTPAHGRDRART